jgi:hypothetical protein
MYILMRSATRSPLPTSSYASWLPLVSVLLFDLSPT